MLDLENAFATFPVLQTERFELRAMQRGDAPAMFRIMNDERVMRYFGHRPMLLLGEAIERIEDVRVAFEEHNGVRWAIVDRADGRFIGTCGFWRLMKAHARAEIGYELAPDWWGKGAMPEALAAALTFGFTRMGLHSVEAQIHPANTGSRRVLEKLGFVQEGLFQENYYDQFEAQFNDTAVFSLLKATWLSRATE